MKQGDRAKLVECYLSLANQWNKKHRLFGSDISARLSESEKALKTWPPLAHGEVFVDVGAGAGVLGFPLLWLNPASVCVFVESDQKKASFLMALKTAIGVDYKERFFIVPKRLEDVSRETVLGFGFEPSGATLFARAFSGPRNIEDSVRDSVFREAPLWVFTKKNSQYQLSQLHFLNP